MKAIALRASHRRIGGQWFLMTVAVGLAACASPADTMPPELGDCNASGDAACTSQAAFGGGGNGPSQGGASVGEGGNVTSAARGTDAAASAGSGAGAADAASAPQPSGD